jgi:hypothetical protein
LLADGFAGFVAEPVPSSQDGVAFFLDGLRGRASASSARDRSAAKAPGPVQQVDADRSLWVRETVEALAAEVHFTC